MASNSNVQSSRVLYEDAYSNYLETAFGECISILSELIRNDPNYDKAQELLAKVKKIKEQKELGNLFYVKQNYIKAYLIYSEALKIDPSNVKLQSIFHLNLAATNYNLSDYKQGVKDATAALQHNPKYAEALVVRAKCYFKLENYKESTQDCKSVLLIEPNDEIENLLKECGFKGSKHTNTMSDRIVKALSLIQNEKAANDLLVNANLHFKEKDYKKSLHYCTQILSSTVEATLRDSYKIEATFLLEKIRTYIEEAIDHAKSNFIQHNYNQCIVDCKHVLNIEESVKARNLLTAATHEKDLHDRLSRIRKLNKIKSFKICIKECEDILRIREIPEVIQILKSIREITENFMAQAKRNFNLEYFDLCIKDCEKSLNIEKTKQAQDLLNAAKTGKINKIMINVGLDRAKNFYNTKHYQDCLNECKEILKMKDVNEARNLIERCEAALKEARDVQRKIKMEKNKHKHMIRANQNLRSEKYKECIAECELILLSIDFEPAKILLKKAKALMREKVIIKIMERARKNFNQKNFKECVQECQKALVMNKDLTEATTLITDAKIEIENDNKNFVKSETICAEINFSKAQYKECIERCFNILKKEELFEVRDMLEKSRIEFNYENLTNYHDILKVDRNADKKAIITSFRSLSLKYHPDKHSNSTKEMYNHCEKIFKKLITAYRELMKF